MKPEDALLVSIAVSAALFGLLLLLLSAAYNTLRAIMREWSNEWGDRLGRLERRSDDLGRRLADLEDDEGFCYDDDYDDDDESEESSSSSESSSSVSHWHPKQ